MQRFVVALALIVSGGAVAHTPAAHGSQVETYAAASLDANGNLVIVKTNGQIVTLRKEGEQTSFSAPRISSGRTAVGAQAMFANCCTSYDIPLELVVYAGGRIHRFKGIGLPIFQWDFADSGARIAYGQEAVHFSCETHYELREIASERLLESVNVSQPCSQASESGSEKLPDWVSHLRAKK